MDNKTIIVVGSPRGGTSLTTGIIERLGVDMGHSQKRDSLNPTGYYEDIELQKFVATIAIKEEKHVSSYSVLGNNKIQQAALQRIDEIKTFMQKVKDKRETETWGWKVLRTCYMLDAFTQVVDNPHLVFVTRNPLDVGKSLVEYRQAKSKLYKPITLQEGIGMCAAYYRTITDFIQRNNTPVLYIKYEDLISTTYKDTINDICKFIGIAVPSIYTDLDNLIRR